MRVYYSFDGLGCVLVRYWKVFAEIIFVAALASCSLMGEDSQDSIVYPEDSSGAFRLIPNESFPGDSSMKWLSRGVIIPGYPAASYVLSFVGDGGKIPDLRLFTLIQVNDGWRIRSDLNVEGALVNGRWEYRFSFSQPLSASWITSLQRGHSRYMGSVQNLQIQTTGSGPSAISVNLWITGQYGFPEGGESPAVLGLQLQAAFRNVFGQAGVTVDTVRVLEASKHPLIGARYPQDIPVLASGIEERFDSLGYGLTGEAANALDLVLVYGLSEVGMLGESPLLGQSLKKGPVGTVVIATQQKLLDGESYSPLPVDDIVGTALHEVGHFFGLRHTSSTRRDLIVGGDFSIMEDGLTDTPFCPGLLEVSVSHLRPGYSRMFATAPLLALACADQNNLMFPFAVEGSVDPLTSQQRKLLRNNVALFDQE